MENGHKILINIFLFTFITALFIGISIHYDDSLFNLFFKSIINGLGWAFGITGLCYISTQIIVIITNNVREDVIEKE